MAESTNRKRAASSPLSSGSDKKLRLGLTDGEISNLNDSISYLISDADKLSAADVTSKILATTLHEVAFTLTTSSCASILDKGWFHLPGGEKRIDELPHEELEDLKSAWVEARNSGWENLAGRGALLLPRPAHANIKSRVVLLQGESLTVEPSESRRYTRGREDQEEGTLFVSYIFTRMMLYLIIHQQPKNHGFSRSGGMPPKVYGNISKPTSLPQTRRCMLITPPSYSHLGWENHEQLMNLGRSTSPYQWFSGRQFLQVRNLSL
jgi:hypothetical protein